MKSTLLVSEIHVTFKDEKIKRSAKRSSTCILGKKDFARYSYHTAAFDLTDLGKVLFSELTKFKIPRTQSRIYNVVSCLLSFICIYIVEPYHSCLRKVHVIFFNVPYWIKRNPTKKKKIDLVFSTHKR